MIQSEKGKFGHLLMNICRMRARLADQLMEKSHIFRGQGMMLMFISAHDGLTHSEIADWLKISPAAATKVIKRLEEEGYLQRRPDANDERVSRVFIRDEGRAVIDDIHQSFKLLDEKTFLEFTKTDLERFGHYLERIQHNLEEHQAV